MLGLRYLSRSSNEERLAGLLLCLKEMESSPDPPSSTFEEILSKLSPLFIAQLVCSRQPVARDAGLTFLSLLPDALTPQFKKYSSLLLDSELKAEVAVDHSTEACLVFEFVVRSMKGSSLAEVTSLIEVALAGNNRIVSPTRLLSLITELSMLLLSPMRLSTHAQNRLRDLVTQCLYLPSPPHSLRSQTLGAIRDLLRTVDSEWTVELLDDPREVGTFARLLCSIVRGELLLLLEHTLASRDAEEVATDSKEILLVCADILESAIALLLGQGESESGPWARLPCDGLLQIRKVGLLHYIPARLYTCRCSTTSLLRFVSL